MVDIELLGVADAAQDFSDSEGPASVYLDVNTGDVWAREGTPFQLDGAIRVISKPLFSDKQLTESELRGLCGILLAILIPQYETVKE